MNELIKSFKKSKGAIVGAALLGILILVALFAPWLAPHDPMHVYDGSFSVPPSFHAGGTGKFLLGTDDLGRDLLSRLIYGARISLGVGLFVVILATLMGGILGLLAGYIGGWVDTVIMRTVDMLMALPSILLAIVVVSILGPSLTNGIIAVAFVELPGFIRIVRAAVLAEKNKSYVDAVKSFGAPHLRIILMNILPNIMAPLIVKATLGFSDGILNVAALGFLGMGAQPPTPEWGVMLADGKAYIESASWLVTYPGFCILIAVLSFNLVGDGLRDALDPKLRGSR